MLTETVKSTWYLVRQAIKSRRTDGALELLEQVLNKATMQHDSIVSFAEMAISHLARFSWEKLGQ